MNMAANSGGISTACGVGGACGRRERGEREGESERERESKRVRRAAYRELPLADVEADVRDVDHVGGRGDLRAGLLGEEALQPRQQAALVCGGRRGRA